MERGARRTAKRNERRRLQVEEQKERVVMERYLNASTQRHHWQGSGPSRNKVIDDSERMRIPAASRHLSPDHPSIGTNPA